MLAKSPLAGYTVALSGTFPGTTHPTVSNRITDLGGNLAKSVTVDTNILISTPADVSKVSKKTQDAQSNGISIVSIDWLDEVELRSDVVDPKDFSLLTVSMPAADVKGKAKKRAASPNNSNAPASKAAKVGPLNTAPKLEPKVGDGSLLKSRNMTIPLDEGCPLQTYRVYVDGDGIVYDASLNKTDASANNNKFYRLQTWTRWGRVGDRGQSKVLGAGSYSDAFLNFNKKFKEKSKLSWADRGEEPKRGAYAYVERSYEADTEDEEVEEVAANVYSRQFRSASPAKSTLAVPVQSLMQLIFNQQYMFEAMSDLNYDAMKMPLGKLSKATINRGFQALTELAALLKNGISSRDEVEDLSNRYYSLIPHNFGRSRPPVIGDTSTLKREVDLLDSLGDMKAAADLMKKDLNSVEKINALDRQFQSLGLEEMSVIDPYSHEYQELANYLINTRGATHAVDYKVENIFRIERQGELDRFQRSSFSKIKSDRRLLWHGSRATNFGGILSQGLRIAPPEAPVSGYMFGKGIYLADMSSKSANYCCSYNSGGHALLLLCEAELGQPMQELTQASYTAGEDANSKGNWSTWGKGMTGPAAWKDAECVHPSLRGVKMPDTDILPTNTNIPGAYLQYNEYIAYDVAQVRLRYLFRVRM
ncbi:PARP-domain-containing protein [Paraphaeosphaeria sporulosa]|uniref:Poly [ADP-ribose] polymerase n=1 Tax=Paraphaeosphaeria sporulosa TaxID=1460663 RepID=A0A177CWP7_9PLEO|nr:PARP-domain-containing protein [Paraphaeosphaeria sporulosa]OAG11646.1 PARP-domain-containing protein [Paraphaeosphaeria sporulosa]